MRGSALARCVSFNHCVETPQPKQLEGGRTDAGSQLRSLAPWLVLSVVLDHSKVEISAGGLVEQGSEKQKEEEAQDKVNLSGRPQ